MVEHKMTEYTAANELMADLKDQAKTHIHHALVALNVANLLGTGESIIDIWKQKDGSFRGFYWKENSLTIVTAENMIGVIDGLDLKAKERFKIIHGKKD